MEPPRLAAGLSQPIRLDQPDIDRRRSPTRYRLARRRDALLLLVRVVVFVSAFAPLTAYAADAPDWTFAFKTQFMFNSHTSYEFGNPYPPYQIPLSRLEFPLNAVWTGFEARRRLGRLSVGLDYLTSLSNQETNHMQDSDWDDDTNPKRLSIYSESGCRLRPSFKLQADIDILVSDLLGMPSAFELRPVVGYRWQHFSFITHDGTQYEYDNPVTVMPLPGNGIDFQQDWCMLFVGTKLGYTWSRPPLFHHIKLKGQADWSHAWGYNIDRHLLRVGNRTTREYTRGDAWHAALEVLFGLTERLDLGVTGDYMRIETTGAHKLTAFDSGFRFSHGVRAWSEQSSITLKLAYSF